MQSPLSPDQQNTYICCATERICLEHWMIGTVGEMEFGKSVLLARLDDYDDDDDGHNYP